MNRHQAIFIVCTTACSGAPTADSAELVDAWWDIDGDQLSATPEVPTEGRLEDYDAELSGELYDDGEGWDGQGGVKARQGSEVLCHLEFGLPQTGDATGCDACEVQLTVTPADVRELESERCDDVGIDPTAMAAASMVLGFEGETLWMQGEGGWAVAGIAWEEGGGWLFEIVLGDGEDME
jgi:hypothetical protein